MAQLNGNLMTARWFPGKNERVNLQMDAGKGSGALSRFSQPVYELMWSFCYKLLKYPCTHSSLTNY